MPAPPDTMPADGHPAPADPGPGREHQGGAGDALAQTGQGMPSAPLSTTPAPSGANHSPNAGRRRRYARSRRDANDGPARLTILQGNVGRGHAAHLTLLETAFRQRADIIAVLEPWTDRHAETRRTKWHPAYRTVCPWENWETRPRAMLYIRRGRADLELEVAADAAPHPDLIACDVKERHARLRLACVYNAPPGSDRTGEAVDRLLDTPMPAHHIWLGDFNLHHPDWEAAPGAVSAQAKRMATHAFDTGLQLLNDFGRPTHRDGGVIDLVWASSAVLLARQVSAKVAEDVHAGSDHEVLRTELGGSGPPLGRPGRYRMDTTSEERFQAALDDAMPSVRAACRSAETCLPTQRPQALDELANEITTAAQASLRVSTKRSTGRGTGYAWWTPGCDAAARQWRTARRAAGTTGAAADDARRTLHREVARAKRDHYTRLINESAADGNFFRATKWARGTGRFDTPALQRADGSWAVTAAEKAALLRETHLPTAREAEDVGPGPEPDGDQVTGEWPRVDAAEAKDAIWSAGNTAPGADDIPPAALRAAWPVLGRGIHVLYDLCLAEGWHPTPFRQAELCAIPKPGKRDRTSLRSYRLIALLSGLGKGLERIVARRLAREAVTRRVLPTGYHGAAPLRSACDLAVELTHDVERAFATGETASLLTFDVKGAYDAVLPGRLVNRLRQQGWPACAVRWVRSFLTGRTAAVRLDATRAPPASLAGSLPLGSPASPILFMLFMQPLMGGTPAPGASRRAGYADDGRLLAVSPSLQQNVRALEAEMEQVLSWAAANAIQLDPAKTELLHFSRKRNNDNPPAQLPGGRTITPTPADRALRWLGVHFDRKLSFRAHVRTRCQMAQTAANSLRMLGGCARGAPAHVMRQAVTACVLPTATFGAEAWWPPPAPVRGGAGWPTSWISPSGQP